MRLFCCSWSVVVGDCSWSVAAVNIIGGCLLECFVGSCFVGVILLFLLLLVGFFYSLNDVVIAVSWWLLLECYLYCGGCIFVSVAVCFVGVLLLWLFWWLFCF